MIARMLVLEVSNVAGITNEKVLEAVKVMKTGEAPGLKVLRRLYI